MIRRGFHADGSVLVITLVTLTAVSLMAAFTLTRLSPRVRMAYQNAAWQEARLAAEAGVDSAMNDLLLNATGFAPGAWTGWQEEADVPGQKPKRSIKDPLVKILNQLLAKLALVNLTNPGGATGTVDSSKSLYLDNVRISATKALPAEVDVQLWALQPASNPNTQWFRIRSMGTCPLPPTAYEPPAGLDSQLRRFSLRHRRPSLEKDDVGTPSKIPLPNISRTIEVLVEPILSFELALWTGDKLNLPKVGAWSIDSFDSTDPAKSADGKYPGAGSTAVQANGHVASGAPPDPGQPYGPSILANGTRVHGAVATNGGDDPATTAHENVSGDVGLSQDRIHDDFSRTMIPLVRPEGQFSLPPLDGTFLTGPAEAPTIYSVHGNLNRLRIRAPLAGLPGAIVVLIDGNLDLSAPLIIPPSVVAVLYVRGNITFRENVNSGPWNSNRATQLLIFGDNATPHGQTVRAIGDLSVCAAFYGPSADIVLDGAVNWSGSLSGLSFKVATLGAGGIHYDEALATMGPTVGFRIARYIEDVRQ